MSVAEEEISWWLHIPNRRSTKSLWCLGEVWEREVVFECFMNHNRIPARENIKKIAKEYILENVLLSYNTKHTAYTHSVRENKLQRSEFSFLLVNDKSL